MAYIIGGKRNGEDWPYDPHRDGTARINIPEPITPTSVSLEGGLRLDDMISHEVFIPMPVKQFGMIVAWLLRHEAISEELAIKSARLRGYIMD